MAVDAVTVFNLALSSLGAPASVQLTSENTREAKVCNMWFEYVRDLVFSTAPWPRLTGFRRLALLDERDQDEDWVATNPDPRWQFAYSLPSDYLRPRYISNYVTFEESMVGDQPTIVTNAETPILVYTRRLERVDLWGIDLIHAVSFGLAAHIAKSITGKDTDLQNMFELANNKILTARANAANARNAAVESTPEWIAARGYSGAGPQNPYIYPNADFIVSGFNNLG